MVVVGIKMENGYKAKAMAEETIGMGYQAMAVGPQTECISPQGRQAHRDAEGRPYGFDTSMRPLKSLEKYKEGPLENFVFRNFLQF